MSQAAAAEPTAVVGAGSWGTALAHQLALVGPVRLWCRRAELARKIAGERVNQAYLPGVRLTRCVEVHDELDRALEGAGRAVLAVPTQALAGVLESVRPGAWPAGPLVLACKGIEVGTLALPSEIVATRLGESAGRRAVALSGPSFAVEMARGEPTAVVAACSDERFAQAVQQMFSLENLRVYTSTDALGVQLSGALKNVVAIAAGVAAGLGFGANSQAALITRSLVEIARLGVAMGARRQTFSGLAGVGDLVLTCTGALSRNRHVGERLGHGESLTDILQRMTMVAEGVETSRAALELARRCRVEMPIVEQVHAILFEHKSPAQALQDLLARPLKAEEEDSRR
ncbi:MAG: NAD(P)-dependent glycerol-3-phosphate dehydrogenase [Acidobacteriota bacterium]|nr:MAG: NAD(P)-dependent glycerol-3-phosphate dehydrogenase [Acidobacteriota bacterium]